MKMFDIESLFEVVVDSALVKAPIPSIEDSINGLVAAKQAGCFAVGMITSFSSQILCGTGADLVVQSSAQLPG